MRFIIASAAALLIAVPIAAQPSPSTAGEKAGATPDSALSPTPPIRDRAGEAAGTSPAGNQDLPKKPPEMQHDKDQSTMPPAGKPAEIPPPAESAPTPPG